MSVVKIVPEVAPAAPDFPKASIRPHAASGRPLVQQMLEEFALRGSMWIHDEGVAPDDGVRLRQLVCDGQRRRLGRDPRPPRARMSPACRHRASCRSSETYRNPLRARRDINAGTGFSRPSRHPRTPAISNTKSAVITTPAPPEILYPRAFAIADKPVAAAAAATSVACRFNNPAQLTTGSSTRPAGPRACRSPARTGSGPPCDLSRRQAGGSR